MKHRISRYGLLVFLLLLLQVCAWSVQTQGVSQANNAAVNQVRAQASQSVRDGLARGNSLLSKGEPAVALMEYNHVLDIDKYNVEAMVGVARCYASQGQWVIACSELEDASMYHPESSLALVNYLYFSNRLGKLDSAILVVKRLFNTTDRAAAEPAERVAQYIVEIDYTSAQWFALKAHLLDPKAFPDASVVAKPVAIHIAPPAPVESPALEESQANAGANTAASQENNNPENGNNNYGVPPAAAGSQPGVYGFGFNLQPFTNAFGGYQNPFPLTLNIVPRSGGWNALNTDFGNGFYYQGGPSPGGYSTGNNLMYAPPYVGQWTW